MRKFANKKLTSSELSFFCTQIAMILKSGMLLSEGIDWMYADIDEGNVKNALYELKIHLSNKMPLHKAMDRSGYFPSYIINISRIGSITGKLEEVMNSLSVYYQREDFLKTKIRNSIFYPSMLFVMMSLVIILLVTKIFPIFEGMLEELGGVSNNSGYFISFDKGILAGRITMALVIVVILLMVLFFILNSREKVKAMKKAIIF